MSFDITRDDQAFVIANTMPGLCHLDIHGNELTNVGLLAILDGCPLLESLNIEGCNNLDITESLWQRLNSQIKHLHIWEDCPDSYNDVQLEFAYEDSNGNSYWEYVEKFDEDDDDDDDDEEEEDDDDDDDDDDDGKDGSRKTEDIAVSLEHVQDPVEEYAKGADQSIDERSSKEGDIDANVVDIGLENKGGRFEMQGEIEEKVVSLAHDGEPVEEHERAVDQSINEVIIL
jgi:hypothetical protein